MVVKGCGGDDLAKTEKRMLTSARAPWLTAAMNYCMSVWLAWGVRGLRVGGWGGCSELGSCKSNVNATATT